MTSVAKSCMLPCDTVNSSLIIRILYFAFWFVATTISFDQPTYNVDESHKEIQIMLVLSKPQHTDITVQVIDFGIIATSK